MSEGILLAKVARGTLLPEVERVARLRSALPPTEARILEDLVTRCFTRVPSC